MIIRKVELETVCGITSKIPDNSYAEIAFAGKSNVGKSSLINALMNRKALAHTSAKPGKTQTINFYNINDCMYLVDLPGYGYASASVEIKAQWGKMIENYLHQSEQLAAVFLLVDIRHEPSDNDRMMYEWMKAQGYEPIIIATKLDKINKSMQEQHLDAIRKGLDPEGSPRVLPFSAQNKQGRKEIWGLIDELIGYEDEDTNAYAADDTSARMQEDQAPEEKNRKPRWKAEGRPVAKKTKKMRRKREASKTAKTGKKGKK